MDSPRPWFQYSLWSLLVLTTIAAVLCSIGATTDWSVPIVMVAGVAVCFIGFGPLSLRKHPQQGFFTAVLGFLVRLVGMGLVAFGLLLWLMAAAGRWR
jgi:hypothetical protein